jgi:hypothetical protein
LRRRNWLQYYELRSFLAFSVCRVIQAVAWRGTHGHGGPAGWIGTGSTR